MPRFADIKGHARTHELLRLAVERDRLPHAYLFCGRKGVGKTETAFALGQYLNCEHPDAGDACGSCRSCRRFGRLQHPDLHWIFPMPGSTRGQRLKGAERAAHVQKTIRDRLASGIHRLSYPGAAFIAIGRDEETRVGSVGDLRRQAGLAPVEARIKVFVVTEAERMTREAANSLLKVLEEPPPDNLLILTTGRRGELPDTIVSRCHGVRFGDLGQELIVKLLMEKGGVVDAKGHRTPPSRDEAAIAASLAAGSLIQAAALLEEDVASVRDEALAFLTRAPGDPGLHEAMARLDEMLGDKSTPKGSRDRRVIELVLSIGVLWLGDLLRAATGSGLSLANRDREKEIRRQARRLSVTEIRKRMEVLDEARAALRGNVYRPLVLYPLVHGWAGAGGRYGS
jgi:DNA polymerase-3 subunit delta'